MKATGKPIGGDFRVMHLFVATAHVRQQTVTSTFSRRKTSLLKSGLPNRKNHFVTESGYILAFIILKFYQV